MENIAYCNDAVANGHTKTHDELGHAANTALPDDEATIAPEEALASDEIQAPASGALTDKVAATGPATDMAEHTSPRADTKREAKDAIALYNESGGLTPLELAIALAKKPEHDVSDYKNPINAMKTKAKRIEFALYRAASKRWLTAEAPNYDARYLSDLLDSILSSGNGFAADTPVKIEFTASKTGCPIDSFMVTKL